MPKIKPSDRWVNGIVRTNLRVSLPGTPSFPSLSKSQMPKRCRYFSPAFRFTSVRFGSFIFFVTHHNFSAGNLSRLPFSTLFLTTYAQCQHHSDLSEWCACRPYGNRSTNLTSMVSHWRRTLPNTCPLVIRGQIMWPPAEACWERINLFITYLYRTANDMTIMLTLKIGKVTHVHPAILLPSYLGMPSSFTSSGTTLNVTADGLIPHWKKQKTSNLISQRHWTFYLSYCLLLFNLLIAIGDGFSSRTLRQWFPIMQVIFHTSPHFKTAFHYFRDCRIHRATHCS